MKKILLSTILAAAVAATTTFANTTTPAASGQEAVQSQSAPCWNAGPQGKRWGWRGHHGRMGGMMGMMGGGPMMGGAGGGCAGGGCGGPGMMFTDPQHRQAFLDATTELRKQMMETRFAYAEALRQPEPNQEELVKLRKQMLTLRKQMIDKMIEVQDQGQTR